MTTRSERKFDVSRDGGAGPPLKVSFLLPLYNEADNIGAVLQSIAEQTYPQACIEVVIAQAPSTDGTAEQVRQFCAEHSELSVREVDNPSANTATGRNRCLAEASGQLVMNYSGHAVADRNMLEVLVAKLCGLPDDVAGVGCAIRTPPTRSVLGRAIDVAMLSPMGGVGHVDSALRGGEDREVRSVAFTLYRRSVLDAVDGFDEVFWCGQDAELNLRLTRRAYKLWFTSETAVTHFKRSRLRHFAGQMFRYGMARAKLTKKFPGSLRAIFLLPTLFTLLLIVMLVGSVLSAKIALATLIAAGAFALCGFVSAAWGGGNVLSIILGPLLYLLMYVCYGVGFMRGLLPYRSAAETPA